MNDTTAAATHWIKYDPISIVGPREREWCLWSMVIKGERNYFSGRLVVIGNQTYLYWEGNKTFNIDDSVFYAHINHIKE